jgi:hypothetical protein
MGETDKKPFLWVLHTDGDGRPGICDWAATETEAEQKLKALRTEQQQWEFWSTTLSEDEAQHYKEMGLLPPEAPPSDA